MRKGGGGGRETTANNRRATPAPVPVPGWMPGVVQHAPFESMLEVPCGGRRGREVCCIRWSARVGVSSSNAMAGCPGAGGRQETDAVRVVLLKLDTSLGLCSRSWKGGPPRPRPRPPRPPPGRGRETTIFLDREQEQCVWGALPLPSLPLYLSTRRNVLSRNTTKTLQKDFLRLEEIYRQKR